MPPFLLPIELVDEPDRPGLEPQFAARAMRELIVIPCYADMPDSELVRQASIIKQVAKGAGGPG